ncbi:TolC family protein [Alphaproteobacteria bacterium]|nr:TolC family protein [Alphaproteobacteria bacterium]
MESIKADTLSSVAISSVPNHPTMVAQRQLLKATKLGVRSAKAGFYPSVDMTVGGSRARTNSSATRGRASRPTDRSDNQSQSRVLTRKESSLTVSQMVFDGWATRNIVKSANYGLLIASEQTLELAQAVTLRVATGYIGVARDRKLLELASVNIERHKDIINRIKIQVDSGGASAADLDQAKARLDGAKAVYLQFAGRLRDSGALYLEAVGSMPENIIFPIPDPFAFGIKEEKKSEESSDNKGSESLLKSSKEFEKDLAFVLNEAIENNHSLKAARITIESLSASQKAARSPFLPRVDFLLLGSRTQNTAGSPGMSSDHVASLNFSYNFYRGGGDTARLKSSKAAVVESRARLREASRLVEQTVRIGFNAWTTASAQVPSLQSRVESSQAALDSYYEQFSLGKRTLLDVLNAENEVFGARSAFAEGNATVLLSQYQVLAAMGKLTEYLGVNSNEIVPNSLKPEKYLNSYEELKDKIKDVKKKMSEPVAINKTPEPVKEVASLIKKKTPEPVKEVASQIKKKTPELVKEVAALIKKKATELVKEVASLIKKKTPEPVKEVASLIKKKAPEPVKEVVSQFANKDIAESLAKISNIKVSSNITSSITSSKSEESNKLAPLNIKPENLRVNNDNLSLASPVVKLSSKSIQIPLTSPVVPLSVPEKVKAPVIDNILTKLNDKIIDKQILEQTNKIDKIKEGQLEVKTLKKEKVIKKKLLNQDKSRVTVKFQATPKVKPLVKSELVKESILISNKANKSLPSTEYIQDKINDLISLKMIDDLYIIKPERPPAFLPAPS